MKPVHMDVSYFRWAEVFPIAVDAVNLAVFRYVRKQTEDVVVLVEDRVRLLIWKQIERPK